MVDFPAEARELFERANYVHVATLMPDGSPHSVAVWAGLEGERIIFYTGSSSRKARNLDRDPRVAISVTDHEDPYRTVRLRGRVVERRTGDEAGAVMDELSLRYTGQPWANHSPEAVLFVIEPERLAYSHLPFTHRPQPPA